MAVNNMAPDADSLLRNSARLKTVGVFVLLLGLASAGLVYWTSAPPQDLSDDMPTARTSKKAARAVEVNFGQMGLVMNDLWEDLQDPGTQALIIMGASILVASGCFYFARLQPRRDEPEGPAA